MASIFQIGISRNTKCALKDGFCKSSHIFEIPILTVASMVSYMITTVKIGISNIIESRTLSSSCS